LGVSKCIAQSRFRVSNFAICLAFIAYRVAPQARTADLFDEYRVPKFFRGKFPARTPELTRMGSTSKPYFCQMPFSAVTRDGIDPGAVGHPDLFGGMDYGCKDAKSRMRIKAREYRLMNGIEIGKLFVEPDLSLVSRGFQPCQAKASSEQSRAALAAAALTMSYSSEVFFRIPRCY
jgi:hypothetical protein